MMGLVRITRYPSRGRPAALTETLDELVMLLQAAISIANTERWALERGEQTAPPALTGLLRHDAYEVTVVDHFHRIARRHFERADLRAVWERPLQTGTPGRPPSVDVALFDSLGGLETRIELGLYTKAKLRSDATKLHGLAAKTLQGYASVVNHVVLWEVKSSRLTDAEANKSMTKFKADAVAVSADAFSVTPLLASAVDLFVVEARRHRHAVVGLFDVT